MLTTELTAVPYVPGSGRLLAIDGAGNVTTIAQTTTTATASRPGPDGSAYVTEISANVGPPDFLAPFTGRVAQLVRMGSVTGRRGLMFPTQAVIGPDGAIYVSISVWAAITAKDRSFASTRVRVCKSRRKTR